MLEWITAAHFTIQLVLYGEVWVMELSHVK